MLTRSRLPSITAVDSTVSCMDLSATQAAAEARHRPAVETVVENLLHAGGVQDRDHHVDEVVFGLVRGGRGFGGVVVAHQRQHAAVLRGAGEIGVAEDVAGAVDARPLAVPEAEHAVELALAAQLRLLRAPQRGRGDVLVEAGLEADVVFVEDALRADELLVEGAERRAAIAGDVARGVEAGAAVALLLHQAEPHDGLEAGDEDAALGEVVLVVERDVVERHRAGLRGQCALATKRAPGSFRLVQRYSPSRRGSNAKKLSRLAISRRPRRRQGNVGAAVGYAFWRTATDRRSTADPTAAACVADILPMSCARLAEPSGVLYNRQQARRRVAPIAARISGPERPCRWMPTPTAVRPSPSRIDRRC